MKSKEKTKILGSAREARMNLKSKLANGHDISDRSAKTYIDQLGEDTGFCRRRAMASRNRWWNILWYDLTY